MAKEGQMAKEKITVDACRRTIKPCKNTAGAPFLLHALPTIGWSNERLLVWDGRIWVNVRDHLWSLYASGDNHDAAFLYVEGWVEFDEDYVRPTDRCLAALGLNEGWYRP